jgi:rare lipoprotein A
VTAVRSSRVRVLQAVVLTACCLAAGCTTRSPGASIPEAGPKTSVVARLLPLTKGLALPPGAAPRSQVPPVNYDITVHADLPLDDGVPGNEAPRPIFEQGGASWYGIQFHMKKTANGERFDMGALTAAHKTLPFGTKVCVRSLVNGKEVLVRINDRGPYAQGRIIDLSRAAADQIGLTALGIKQVALSVIDQNGMRCGGEAVQLSDALTASAARPAARRSARKVSKPARRRR